MARSFAMAPAFMAALALGAWTGGAGMERMWTGGPAEAGEAASYEAVDLPAFVVTLATSGGTVHALAYLSADVRKDALSSPSSRDRLQEAVLMATADALSRPGAEDGEVASLIAAGADGRLGGSAIANVHVRRITVFAPAG